MPSRSCPFLFATGRKITMKNSFNYAELWNYAELRNSAEWGEFFMVTFHPERTSEQEGAKTRRRGDDSPRILSPGCRVHIPKNVSSWDACFAIDHKFGKMEIPFGEITAETGDTAEDGRCLPQGAPFYFRTAHYGVGVRSGQKRGQWGRIVANLSSGLPTTPSHNRSLGRSPHQHLQGGKKTKTQMGAKKNQRKCRK